MSNRFDTPGSERERRKKGWGNGWRMQDLNQHVKKTEDIFSIIAGRNKPETEQIRERKIKPPTYYNRNHRKDKATWYG